MTAGLPLRWRRRGPGSFAAKAYFRTRALSVGSEELVARRAVVIANGSTAAIPAIPGRRGHFLCDPGRKLQKDLDIAEYTDPDHNPMIRHALVPEPGLRVFKICNGYWFFGRPTVEELRLDLRAVLQRCRSDWNISAADLRTAWAKGDKAKFSPYGKAQAQVIVEQDRSGLDLTKTHTPNRPSLNDHSRQPQSGRPLRGCTGRDFIGGEHFAGYCPLGQGKVDLKAILDMVEGVNPNANIMVELDGSANMPYTALQTAQISKTYLQTLGYTFRTL
jgi:hypothetical protein